jgi:hypothetical protein
MIINIIKLYLKILNLFKIRIKFLDLNNKLCSFTIKKPKYYIYNNNNNIYISKKLLFDNMSDKKLFIHSDIDIDDIKYIEIYLINTLNNNIKYYIQITNDININIYDLLKKNLFNKINFFKLMINTSLDSNIYSLIYYYLQNYLNINDIIDIIKINYNDNIIVINENDTLNNFINKII